MIVGNWGLNTRLTASVEQPLNLYRFDFDNNGKIDPITTYFYKGTETALATKDELVKQLPFLNKKFLSYHDFAKAGITDLLSEEKLEKTFLLDKTDKTKGETKSLALGVNIT